MASPLPRPRPVGSRDIKPAEALPVELKPAEPKSRRSAERSIPCQSVSAPPRAGFQQCPATAGADPGLSATTLPASHGSRRVAAVQRVLTEYGYGQLKPTGTIGSDTQAAIQKFERERKIPVTGQMSDRLVRELAAMTGQPID